MMAWLGEVLCYELVGEPGVVVGLVEYDTDASSTQDVFVQDQDGRVTMFPYIASTRRSEHWLTKCFELRPKSV